MTRMIIIGLLWIATQALGATPTLVEAKAAHNTKLATLDNDE